jgi:hypothetical protein
MRLLILTILVAAVFAVWSCQDHDNTPICTPAAAQSCWCNRGLAGTQTCHDDGLDYGPCVCNPDAGADAPGVADAGVDAAGIDAAGVDATSAR